MGKICNHVGTESEFIVHVHVHEHDLLIELPTCHIERPHLVRTILYRYWKNKWKMVSILSHCFSVSKERGDLFLFQILGQNADVFETRLCESSPAVNFHLLRACRSSLVISGRCFFSVANRSVTRFLLRSNLVQGLLWIRDDHSWALPRIPSTRRRDRRTSFTNLFLPAKKAREDDDEPMMRI